MVLNLQFNCLKLAKTKENNSFKVYANYYGISSRLLREETIQSHGIRLNNIAAFVDIYTAAFSIPSDRRDALLIRW